MVYILNHTDVFFKQVDGLVAKIKAYQDSTQLDLYDQEYWFTHDFSYPFIGIHLNYYPEHVGMSPVPGYSNQSEP